MPSLVSTLFDSHVFKLGPTCMGQWADFEELLARTVSWRWQPLVSQKSGIEWACCLQRDGKSSNLDQQDRYRRWSSAQSRRDQTSASEIHVAITVIHQIVSTNYLWWYDWCGGWFMKLLYPRYMWSRPFPTSTVTPIDAHCCGPSWTNSQAVFLPKCLGAWNLHRCDL